ncbi:MAG: ribonuclease P protein component [Nitrospinae bacterium]|nr:ribonuclease P protein component [Nitrospinota bacterium]MBI5428631.1 ribonuclease P protein component [Nitrospinota bacterium]
MAGQSFGKRERLLKRFEFENVMDKGRKTRIGDICTVFCLKNGLDRHRLGIISSRKIGNAPQRNRSKRRMREAFRRIKNAIPTPMDIVIIVGKGAAPLSFPVLQEKIGQTLRCKRQP